uniref:Uncharacterized protein n=1 Tax=Anguilla anguilla TaxID=7936 RepID=A0A0E9PYF1_ANGAN
MEAGPSVSPPLDVLFQSVCTRLH